MPIKKKKKSLNYFTEETEDAILLYNKTPNPSTRSKIYSKSIHYPFFKLTQNIIHTFKFYYTEVDDLEHLQHEIIVYLLDRMDKYHHSKSVNDRLYKYIVKEFQEDYVQGSFICYTNNADKVTQEQINSFINSLDLSVECFEKVSKITPPKAYSYFGTIVKRYLIAYNETNYKKKIIKTGIEELSKEGTSHYYTIEESSDESPLNQYMDLYIDYCTLNIYKLFPKSNDAQIADAILELFRKRETIEIFNKKALYIYIREIIDVKTPKITKISTKLNILFQSNYVFYLDNGYVNF
jgi:hypothetical protein